MVTRSRQVFKISGIMDLFFKTKQCTKYTRRLPEKFYLYSPKGTDSKVGMTSLNIQVLLESIKSRNYKCSKSYFYQELEEL